MKPYIEFLLGLAFVLGLNWLARLFKPVRDVVVGCCVRLSIIMTGVAVLTAVAGTFVAIMFGVGHLLIGLGLSHCLFEPCGFSDYVMTGIRAMLLTFASILGVALCCAVGAAVVSYLLELLDGEDK